MTVPRLFTLEQAERTLPLVRRIVEDLVQVYPEWRAGVARYEALSLDAKPEAGHDYNGPLKEAIATNVAGIQMGELLVRPQGRDRYADQRR